MRLALLPLCVLLALPAAAQDRKRKGPDGPKLLFTVPLAVGPGFKGKVAVRGFGLGGATEVRAADPRAAAKLVGKPKTGLKGPNNTPTGRVGDAEAEVELEVPKDFPAGELELVPVGPEGPGGAYKLLVDPAGVPEAEPNDGFAQAQEVPLPATVDGRIGKEKDVDVFRFAGKAGDKVAAEVRAARLGAPTDALLTLYDADRRVVDSCDDADGTPDPVLAVTLPRDGTYYLAVLEAHDAGGPVFPYRLRLSR